MSALGSLPGFFFRANRDMTLLCGNTSPRLCFSSCGGVSIASRVFGRFHGADGGSAVEIAITSRGALVRTHGPYKNNVTKVVDPLVSYLVGRGDSLMDVPLRSVNSQGGP